MDASFINNHTADHYGSAENIFVILVLNFFLVESTHMPSRVPFVTVYRKKSGATSSAPPNGVFSRPLIPHRSLFAMRCKNGLPGRVPRPWICYRYCPIILSLRYNHTHTHTTFQLHWSDYSARAYIPALQHLHALQQPPNRLVNALGLCNFDTARTDEICTALGPGVIVSNQVQVNLHPSSLAVA